MAPRASPRRPAGPPQPFRCEGDLWRAGRRAGALPATLHVGRRGRRRPFAHRFTVALATL